MENEPYDFDLISIGSGPGGQRAAIQAAKLGKRVAVVEKQPALGGVCVNTGTIPSKTLREAAVVLSGHRERGFYGSSFRMKDHFGVEDLLFRSDVVVRNEVDVVRDQLIRNDIEVFEGRGFFVDPTRSGSPTSVVTVSSATPPRRSSWPWGRDGRHPRPRDTRRAHHRRARQ